MQRRIQSLLRTGFSILHCSVFHCRLGAVPQVHVGPAVDVLETLSSEGPFDAVFIDADKENYPKYLDWVERGHVRVGGAVFADNTFAFGHVWRDADTIVDNPKLRSQVTGLQRINARLADSPNFRATILPTNQGLTMAVRLK